MEVSLIAFLSLLAVFLHCRFLQQSLTLPRMAAEALVCALTAMSRPEGVFVFLLLFASHVVHSLRQRSYTFFYFGLFFTVFFLPYLLWRHAYYGYWLPNTFYAKVGGNLSAQAERGLKYLGRFAVLGLCMAAPAVTGFFCIPGLIRRHGAAAVSGVLFALVLVYVLWVGGDVMPSSRFLAHFLPVISVWAALVLGAFLETRLQLLFAVCMIVLYQQILFHEHPEQLDKMVNGGRVSRKGEDVGKWMREHYPEGTLVALNTAGSIPFYSKLPCIDTLGLNDAHIAHRTMPRMGHGVPGHEKGDGAYVLSRDPDVIQFSSASGRKEPGSFPGDKEVFADPRFKENYVLREYQVRPGLKVVLYEHKRLQPSATEEEEATPPAPPPKRVRVRRDAQ